MSKFSSYKQSQLLFENWRKHVNEGEEQLEILPWQREAGGRRPSWGLPRNNKGCCRRVQSS